MFSPSHDKNIILTGVPHFVNQGIHCTWVNDDWTLQHHDITFSKDISVTANLHTPHRSVVVAGGTMEPISEFQDQLFLSAGGAASRVQHFSCGHVVPANQLLPVVLPQGPTGITLDFTYQHRADPKVVSVWLIKHNKCFIWVNPLCVTLQG